MFKSILIPTDGTEFCQRAIAKGVELAKLTGARIVGVTVTRPLRSGAPEALLPAQISNMIATETQKFAAGNLAAVEAAAKAAGIAVETVQETDDHPWEAILGAAKKYGADVIVMASHGRRGVAAMVLGSETQKVLTHSTIPVLVVR